MRRHSGVDFKFKKSYLYILGVLLLAYAYSTGDHFYYFIDGSDWGITPTIYWILVAIVCAIIYFNTE